MTQTTRKPTPKPVKRSSAPCPPVVSPHAPTSQPQEDPVSEGTKEFLKVVTFPVWGTFWGLGKACEVVADSIKAPQRRIHQEQAKMLKASRDQLAQQEATERARAATIAQETSLAQKRLEASQAAERAARATEQATQAAERANERQAQRDLEVAQAQQVALEAQGALEARRVILWGHKLAALPTPSDPKVIETAQTHWALMEALVESQSPSELARLLGGTKTRQAIAKNLDTLETHGLVTKDRQLTQTAILILSRLQPQ